MTREHRERVGADLVRGVPVRRDAVGARDHAVDVTGRHQRRGGRIGDHRVRYPGRLELPGGQPRPLQERPRLVDPDVREEAALPGREQCTDGAAVAASRQPARIAVRQCARSRSEELRGVRGHPPAALDLVRVDAARMLERWIVAHRVERPPEVDGGWARRAKHAIGLREILALRGRERNPVGRCDADRRRTTHDHGADRVCDLGRGLTCDIDFLERQAPLVEEHHPVVLEPEDPFRLEHEGPSQRPCRRRGPPARP